MTLKTRGGCLCRIVEFEIEGEFESFFLCHCSRCRKDTGSAHAANLFSSSARLTWLAGQENTHRFDLPGTRHSRTFCAACGSALPSLLQDGALLVVPAGSLDDEVSLRPNAHICMADRADWDDRLEEIPRLRGLPG